MAEVSKVVLKTYFEDGKEPDENKFIDFIDTMVDHGVWTPYHDISNIDGWSSYTQKQIFYKKIDNLVFIQFYIEGISDDIIAIFTMPFTALEAAPTHSAFWLRAKNAGSWIGTGMGYILGNSNLMRCYTSASGAAWTASGTKAIQGEAWFITE